MNSQLTVGSHRRKPSIFDDLATGLQIFGFPMISGFILDMMHLLDGGVIKDFFRRIMGRIFKFKRAKADLLSKASSQVQSWIDIFNKTNITELCKFRYISD